MSTSATASEGSSGNAPIDGNDVETDGACSRDSSKLEEEATIGSILLSFEFGLFLATFALLQAVGSGVFIANLSLMLASLGVDQSQRLLFVRMVSYCNCGGRLACGALMDFFEPRGIPRAAFTVGTAALLLAAALVLRLSAEALLFPCLISVGIAYGGNWAIMPSFIAARFGTARMGVCFNLMSATMSVVVLLVSSTVGRLYDVVWERQVAAGSEPGEGGLCRGAACWHGAYALAMGLGAAGLATACAVTRRTSSAGAGAVTVSSA